MAEGLTCAFERARSLKHLHHLHHLHSGGRRRQPACLNRSRLGRISTFAWRCLLSELCPSIIGRQPSQFQSVASDSFPVVMVFYRQGRRAYPSLCVRYEPWPKFPLESAPRSCTRYCDRASNEPTQAPAASKHSNKLISCFRTRPGIVGLATRRGKPTLRPPRSNKEAPKRTHISSLLLALHLLSGAHSVAGSRSAYRNPDMHERQAPYANRSLHLSRLSPAAAVSPRVS